jgi:hypothetical protein
VNWVVEGEIRVVPLWESGGQKWVLGGEKREKTFLLGHPLCKTTAENPIDHAAFYLLIILKVATTQSR